MGWRNSAIPKIEAKISVFPEKTQKNILPHRREDKMLFVMFYYALLSHVMLVFLALNGIEPEYTQEELSDMVLGAASGELQFVDMVKWIMNH